jgi:hypothetical protein
MPLFDVNLMDGIARACRKYPERAVDITQSFKHNQLISKHEVVKNIPKSSNVCVLGGWYGVGFMMMRHDNQTKYTCIDRDSMCKLIGEEIDCKQFSFQTADALTFNTNPYNLIVNCSTEHMNNELLKQSFKNINFHKLCIFQNNNNFNVPDHINCFHTLSEFEEYLGEDFSIHSATETIMDNNTKRYTVVCRKM